MFVCKMITLACLLIAGATILGCSFAIIEPTEVGMYYSPVSKTLDTDKIWESGRHAVCPGCYFYKYPTNMLMFEFSDRTDTSERTLPCWSRDKQELSVEIFVQLKIVPDNVPTIWEKYNDNYFNVYSRKVQMCVKETTKDFDTNQFFEERLEVLAALKAKITETLEPEGLEVKAVYMGYVNIPTEFEEAVTTKVIKQQNAQTVFMERNVTLINSDTAIIQAKAGADAEVTRGTKEAQARVMVEQATADGIKIVQSSEAQALSELATELGLSTDQLLAYKKARLVRALGSQDSVIVGFESEELNTDAA